jgi:hypothetical protein
MFIDLTDLTPEAEEDLGPRRGRRVRYAPLEWWRLERVEYGAQHEERGSMVAQIKTIVRVPQEDPQPLGARRRKGRRAASAKPRSKSQSKARDEEEEIQGLEEAYNPEEGWDDETDPYGIVKDWDTGDEVQRRKLCSYCTKCFWLISAIQVSHSLRGWSSLARRKTTSSCFRRYLATASLLPLVNSYYLLVVRNRVRARRTTLMCVRSAHPDPLPRLNE